MTGQSVSANQVTLITPAVMLREPHPSDATALWRRLDGRDLASLMRRPPSSSADLQRFFQHTRREHDAGRCVCMTVHLRGESEPAGIIHARSLEPGFGIAEWDFCIATPNWETGVFLEAAAAFADFLFATLAVRRLEARLSPSDGRAVAALRTLGAEAEALLRQLCDVDGQRWGRVLWTIHRDVWLSRALKPEYASERTARTPHMTGPDDPAPVPDWRRRVLPMQGPGCTVREFTLQDAPALSALLGQPGVARYLSPPPDDIAGFERFIDWSHAQRALGRSLALGIVPAREERVAGILQLHSLHPRFDLAEWGFAIGERYWGTGLFQAAAQLLLTFAFEAVQVRRLEARARVDNARATQALRKLGAVPEGRLRGHDPADPDRDDILWSILDDEWLTRDASPPRCA